MTAHDWTPDGPNCRQCGRHDYLLHLHADEIHEWSGCKTHADCPLATKPVAKLELWSPPLKWTSEPPTVPGQYWWRFEDFGAEVVLIEQVGGGGELWQLSVYGIRRPLAQKSGEWAGPLVAP